MIDLKLPTWQHKIRVDSLYVDHTYAGMLEGRPDEGLNQRIIERSVELVAKLWGTNRPVHVIPPALDKRDPAHPVLPERRCLAWLECWHPVKDKSEDGSHLFVVWFQNGATLSADALEFMFRELDWPNLAKDFGV